MAMSPRQKAQMAARRLAAVGEEAVLVARGTEKRAVLPTGDMVLLELDEKGTTEAGLILPEGASSGYLRTWTVVAVGPGKVLIDGAVVPVALKVGDKVLIAPQRSACQVLPLPACVGERETVLVEEIAVIAVVADNPVLQ